MRTLRAFISHNHEDNGYCQGIVDGLKNHGIDTWFDEEDAGPAYLIQELQRQIQHREVFIPIFSYAAFNSRYVRLECEWAHKLYMYEPTRTIIPVTAESITEDDFIKTDWLFMDEYHRIESPGLEPLPIDIVVKRLLQWLAIIEPEPGTENIIKLGAEDLMTRGRAYLAQEKYEKAYQWFEQATKTDPMLLEGWYCKGETLMKLDHLGEALAAFDRCIKIQKEEMKKDVQEDEKKKRPIAWYGRGKAMTALIRHAEALKSYKTATSLDTDYALAWAGVGEARQNLGRHRLAIAAFQQAITYDAFVEKAYYGKGESFENIGRLGEALLSFEQALADNPENTEAWLRKARLLTRMHGRGRFAEAIDAYESAIRIENKRDTKQRDKRCWAELGDLFDSKRGGRRGYAPKALAMYKKVIEIDPNDQAIWGKIGTLTDTKHLDEPVLHSEATSKFSELARWHISIERGDETKGSTNN